jgi:ATP-dependent helicase Lhr and Lhr-like helicase
MDIQKTPGYKIISRWLKASGLKPFSFQEETWQHIVNGDSGLVNAPTGFGKTYSVFLGSLIRFINEHPRSYQTKKNNGLQLLWISPLRALAKDIGRAMEEVIAQLELPWQVAIRNGDTEQKERQRQKRQMPEVLIITPESLHLLLAQKGYPNIFAALQIIAVDEWHELIGSKRGVQTELAISRLAALSRTRKKKIPFMCWGISATIGNMQQAKETLLSPLKNEGVIVKANLEKKITVSSVFPDEIEKFPWAGHLGLKLLHKIIPIIENSTTTLVFINTRGMSETWYQALLNAAPHLAGAIALHHGSIDQELRIWVEEALHTAKLKAVICTSSLDLGVDFRPVETVIQVGSPKGVSRFLQRAGRSGHQPGATSHIHFLPTHSLELMEAAALKSAMEQSVTESRIPMSLCYDTLIQYLCTLAIGDGFVAEEMYDEIRSTACFNSMEKDEWRAVLQYLVTGGSALEQYDDYKKVELVDGVYRILGRRVAMRHRMHIGTIVSETMMKVKWLSGGYIGVIEEWFIARLNPGDAFTFGGNTLELIAIKEMTALVKKSNKKKAAIPSFQGGRMPLSANLGVKLREMLDIASGMDETENIHPEIKILQPLFQLQQQLSHVPRSNELLIEHITTEDGFHLFVYPFEGRLVHEAMAAILAFRISRLLPISFSFAMNDYGFELLSDSPIPVDDENVYALFSPDNLLQDIQSSVNASEMAMRKFRDVAVIGGLIFQGYPGEYKKPKHLQASASLLFKVLSEYEPGNLLLKQSYSEVLEQQMEEARLRDMLQRVQKSKVVITHPQQLTPFCFPLKVDSIREDLSSEKLEDRVKKMQRELEG